MENPEITPIPIKIPEVIRLQGFKIEVRRSANPDGQLQSLEKALKILKRKLEKDGVLREIKERKCFIKPSMIEHIRVGKIERLNELNRKKLL